MQTISQQLCSILGIIKGKLFKKKVLLSLSTVENLTVFERQIAVLENTNLNTTASHVALPTEIQ
jgi:hypothetical protein